MADISAEIWADSSVGQSATLISAENLWLWASSLMVKHCSDKAESDGSIPS